MRTVFALFPSIVLSASTAFGNPCAEVSRVKQALATSFTSERTRMDGATEKLAVPLFGEPECAIHRPVGVLTKRWIICTINQVSDDVEDDRSFAKSKFDSLAATLNACLPTLAEFDNRANESPSDEIFDRRHYRSADGRETWAVTFEDASVPSAVIVAELEGDGDAEAPPPGQPPAWMDNVLQARACQLFDEMAALARSNFAGVDTKRVRTEWALVKPIGGADQCLIARDPVRGENVIVCSWRKTGAGHSDWARTVSAARLAAARSCRKGWAEVVRAHETEFANPAGDTLAVGMQAANGESVVGTAVSVKTR